MRGLVARGRNPYPPCIFLRITVVQVGYWISGSATFPSICLVHRRNTFEVQVASARCSGKHTFTWLLPFVVHARSVQFICQRLSRSSEHNQRSSCHDGDVHMTIAMWWSRDTTIWAPWHTARARSRSTRPLDGNRVDTNSASKSEMHMTSRFAHASLPGHRYIDPNSPAPDLAWPPKIAPPELGNCVLGLIFQRS